MSDNNVLKFSQPSTFSDPLIEVLRSGARSRRRWPRSLMATPRHAPKKAADGWCEPGSGFRPPCRDPVHGQGLFDRFSGGAFETFRFVFSCGHDGKA